MKFLAAIVLLWIAALAPLRAAEGIHALDALRLLPESSGERVAMITGRDGEPTPERWHFIVYDPAEPSGLHEYVVAKGEVVASRSLSQFAETVAPADVVGSAAIKIDSKEALSTARKYVESSKLTPAAYAFSLRKEPKAEGPLWTVACLDQEGRELAKVKVAANSGKVIEHDGFPVTPEEKEAAQKPPERPAATESRTERTAAAAAAAAAAAEKPASRKPPVIRAREEPVRVLPAEPVAVEEPRRGFFRRAGSSLRKFVTGREASPAPAPSNDRDDEEDDD